MRKIFILIAVIILSLNSFGQVIWPKTAPTFQQFASATTWSQFNGMLYPVVGFVPSTYADTTTANNNSYIRFTPLCMIATMDGKYWRRNIATTKWEEITIGGGGGSGTVTSVGLSMPSAFNVANSPITTSGTLAVTGAGTTAQYVRGDGSLASFPAITNYWSLTGNDITNTNSGLVNIGLGTPKFVFKPSTEEYFFDAYPSDNYLLQRTVAGSGYNRFEIGTGGGNIVFGDQTSQGNQITQWISDSAAHFVWGTYSTPGIYPDIRFMDIGVGPNIRFGDLDNAFTTSKFIFDAFNGDTALIKVGQLRIQNGTEGNGKVLTSNAGGVATWQTPSTVATSVPISGLTAATGTNSINNANFQQTWGWNSFDGNGTNGLFLNANTTASAVSADALFAVSISGANATSSVTSTATSISNTHTGTSSTNIGLTAIASGANNNYALIVPSASGSVGIGTSAPGYLFDVTANSANVFGASIYNNNAGTNSGGLRVAVNHSSTGHAFQVLSGSGGTTSIFDVEANGEVLFTGSGGTSGQVLTSGGSNAPPTWQTPTTGTVTGTGVSGRATFWNGTSSITSSANYLYTDAPTTGSGLSVSASTITSGNLLNLTGTSTVLASGNELLNIASSGANGTSGITATGANISVTNTGTTSTNVGLAVTATGASTNTGILATGTSRAIIARSDATNVLFQDITGTIPVGSIGRDNTNNGVYISSDGGAGTFASGGSVTTGINIGPLNTAGTIRLSVGAMGTAANERITINTSSVVVNEGSSDVNFRVESDADANLLVADAGLSRIGIGTASPSEILHVVGNIKGTGFIELTDISAPSTPASGFGRTYVRADSLRFKNSAGTEFTVGLGGTNYWTASGSDIYNNNAGNVGINNPTPAVQLDVIGAALFSTNSNPNAFVLYNTSSVANVFRVNNDDTKFLFDETNLGYNLGIGVASPAYKLDVNGEGNFVGNVYATGSFIPSDARYKLGVKPISNATNLLMKLSPSTYTMNLKDFPKMGFDDNEHMGLIAQDVEKLIPGVVKEVGGLKRINYAELVPLLIATIQEQNKRIESLEKRIK